MKLLFASCLIGSALSQTFEFAGGCQDKPFLVSTAAAEGNYGVSITFGEGDTTVRAEARRLMLESIRTAGIRAITVNVRHRGNVRLKPRELKSLNWDEKLTLEFDGPRPCIERIDIHPAANLPTIYLAGDSTVVDQDREPWAAWGQMLPRFFGPGVAISNQAESGESLKSFEGEGRLDKILSIIRPGDYLFVQFTHNDQKPGPTHVDPFNTYKEHLKLFINEARKRGATPVLVTSMHRRSFDAQGKIVNTLGQYPEAMRQTATEEHVPLIDLNAMSKVLFESMGPEASRKAFVHYAAGTYPDQREELKDDTHFNTYGAYELARCVVEGIKAAKLDIAKHLLDAPPYDPAHRIPAPLLMEPSRR